MARPGNRRGRAPRRPGTGSPGASIRAGEPPTSLGMRSEGTDRPAPQEGELMMRVAAISMVMTVLSAAFIAVASAQQSPPMPAAMGPPPPEPAPSPSRVEPAPAPAPAPDTSVEESDPADSDEDGPS